MQLSKATFKAGLVTLCCMLIFCGEDDSNYISNSGTSPSTEYAVETEPSLSTSGQYVYYVAADGRVPDKSGIYRAPVTAPIREQLRSGTDFHSPVQSFDGSTVAFLADGSINYLSLANGSVSPAGVAVKCAALVFLNDSLMVGSSGGSVYLINRNDSELTLLGSGSDPTFYWPNQFVCLVRSAGGYLILMYTVSQIEDRFDMRVDTLQKLSSAGVIRWVSMAPGGSRYAYVEQLDGRNRVYTGQIGSSSRVSVAATNHPKTCMLNANALIYSGPDGRFYQSSFDGSSQAPFWHAEDVE